MITSFMPTKAQIRSLTKEGKKQWKKYLRIKKEVKARHKKMIAELKKQEKAKAKAYKDWRKEVGFKKMRMK